MPKSSRYVPTHRAPGKHKAVGVRRRALRTGVAMTGLAAAVTGVSVAGGLLSDDSALTPAAADVATTTEASPESSPQDTSTPAYRHLPLRASYGRRQGDRPVDVGRLRRHPVGEAVRGRPA